MSTSCMKLRSKNRQGRVGSRRMMQHFHRATFPAQILQGPCLHSPEQTTTEVNQYGKSTPVSNETSYAAPVGRMRYLLPELHAPGTHMHVVPCLFQRHPRHSLRHSWLPARLVGRLHGHGHWIAAYQCKVTVASRVLVCSRSLRQKSSASSQFIFARKTVQWLDSYGDTLKKELHLLAESIKILCSDCLFAVEDGCTATPIRLLHSGPEVSSH